jgi:alcohol dehydrogenase class IV
VSAGKKPLRQSAIRKSAIARSPAAWHFSPAMRFEFASAQRILFGPQTVREAGRLAADLGRHALVVAGRDSRRAAPLLELLQESGVGAAVFSVAGEPDLDTIRRGAALARRERCDLAVSFGGGSVLDAGKAIAAMMTNEGDLLDYIEIIGRGRTLAKPSAPLLAIPTTAGTGSEATRNAVLASPEHRVKVSLRSPFLLPTLALVDPELTRDLPPALTATTGLDALTQLIEPYTCLRTNPMTDALCEEGMRRAARSLRAAFANGRDDSAREDMALASLFGGMALANAGLGAVHGLAGPIGGMFPAPHGAVCAALLPRVLQANLRALRLRQPGSPALARYQTAARLLTGNPRAGADDGVEWVRSLVSGLQIPGLGLYGIKRENAAELVAKAAQASSMKANPIALTPAELSALLEEAL